MVKLVDVVRAKVRGLMNNMVDPNTMLDYQYEKQLDIRRNVKRGLTDMVTAKKKLEQHRYKTNLRISELSSKAETAVKTGKDDLARQQIELKLVLQAQVDGMSEQLAELEKEQTKLTTTVENLSYQIEILKVKKETIKAQYSAGVARTEVAKSLTGIGDNMNIGTAIEESEDLIASMKARSMAIEELTRSGVLTGVTASSVASEDVERELVRMKAEVGSA